MDSDEDANTKTIRIGTIGTEDHEGLDAAVGREAKKATLSFDLGDIGDLLGGGMSDEIEHAFMDATKGLGSSEDSVRGVGMDLKEGLSKIGEQLKKAMEEATAQEQRRLDIEKGMSREVAMAWGLVIGAVVMWLLHANWNTLLNVAMGRRGRSTVTRGGGGRSGRDGVSGPNAEADAWDPHRAQLATEMRDRQAARAVAAEAAEAAAAERQQAKAEAKAAAAVAVAAVAAEAAEAAAAAVTKAEAVGLTQRSSAAAAAAEARDLARRAFLSRQQALLVAASKQAQENKEGGNVE